MAGRFRVVIADLAGEPIEEVPARGLQFPRALNDPGSCSFDLLKKDAKSVRSLLEPGQRKILVRDGDMLRFVASLDAISGGSDSNTIKIGGPGFHLARLSDRFIDVNRNYDDVEQFDIAWDLIDWTQTKTAGADLGITRWDHEVPSGVVRSVGYHALDRPVIAESLKSLAGADDGFDFEITPDGIWKVHHPSQGGDSDAAFIHPRKNILSFQYTIDAGDVTSHLTAIGGELGITAASWSSGDHKITYTAKDHTFLVGKHVTVQGMDPQEYNVSDAAITNVTADTFKVAGPSSNPGAATQFGTATLAGRGSNILDDADDAAALERYGLRERSVQFSDIHARDVLASTADATVAAMASPTEQPSIVATTSDPDSALDVYDLGDTARVAISDGFFDVDDVFRIVGITVQVSDEGQVTVAVAFDKRTGAKWIHGRDVRRQLADLLVRVGKLERRS